MADNRCPSFCASGHRILPARSQHLRSHPFPAPVTFPPLPGFIPRRCVDVCLSCSLFWLRHFKAPRGSLGIIFFFLLLKCQRAPSNTSHGLGARSQSTAVPMPSAPALPLPALPEQTRPRAHPGTVLSQLGAPQCQVPQVCTPGTTGTAAEPRLLLHGHGHVSAELPPSSTQTLIKCN